jgi:hypothetical protein
MEQVKQYIVQFYNAECQWSSSKCELKSENLSWMEVFVL